MIWLLILLLICYLLGSFPSGSLVAKRWGVADLSQVGSGSIGATNAFRITGFKPALLVLALDVAKGFVAVCLAYLVWLPPFLFPLVKVTFGLAAIAGHNWSIFSGFKGGKGVATTCGVFLALVPQAVGRLLERRLGLSSAGLRLWGQLAGVNLGYLSRRLSYLPTSLQSAAPSPRRRGEIRFPSLLRDPLKGLSPIQPIAGRNIWNLKIYALCWIRF